MSSAQFSPQITLKFNVCSFFSITSWSKAVFYAMYAGIWNIRDHLRPTLSLDLYIWLWCVDLNFRNNSESVVVPQQNGSRLILFNQKCLHTWRKKVQSRIFPCSQEDVRWRRPRRDSSSIRTNWKTCLQIVASFVVLRLNTAGQRDDDGWNWYQGRSSQFRCPTMSLRVLLLHAYVEQKVEQPDLNVVRADLLRGDFAAAVRAAGMMLVVGISRGSPFCACVSECLEIWIFRFYEFKSPLCIHAVTQI